MEINNTHSQFQARRTPPKAEQPAPESAPTNTESKVDSSDIGRFETAATFEFEPGSVTLGNLASILKANDDGTVTLTVPEGTVVTTAAESSEPAAKTEADAEVQAAQGETTATSGDGSADQWIIR